jgi:uncharacterized RDD family membrane protein YckC
MRFFNRITLQTPESVELEFTLAGIGNRALAFSIDYIFLLLVVTVFLSLWWLFTNQLFTYFDRLGINYSGLANWLLAIAALITFAIWVGYFVFFETLWRGQTPGKRFAKIRVIRDDGRPVRLPQAVLRALLRPVDDMLSIGVWLIMLTQREKRLGDWAAGTLVVQDERFVASASFPVSDQAQVVADHLLQTANLTLLLPDDFAVIREYLQRRSLMNVRARSALSLKLAEQAKAIIELEKLPNDMTPDLFLEGVYLAYQQQRT